MNEELSTCEWCGQNEGKEYFALNGERFCTSCQPYAWNGFTKPGYYESNKQLAIKKAKRRGTFAKHYENIVESLAVEPEINTKEVLVVDNKELVTARIAFGVLFAAVLVAVYGIYLVGDKC
jgi:predicted heme/steroid binding protein